VDFRLQPAEQGTGFSANLLDAPQRRTVPGVCSWQPIRDFVKAPLTPSRELTPPPSSPSAASPAADAADALEEVDGRLMGGAVDADSCDYQ